MTNRLSALLGDRLPLFDGGYGWLLQERGLPPGEVAEAWNVENPEAIAGLHEEYAEAGAKLITTNTFGGTRPRLEQSNLGDKVTQLNEAGARLAASVAHKYGALVAADIGPTGELLEPIGALSLAEASELFAEQIRALVAGGADLILIETMSDLNEVRAAVGAAHEVAPGLPVVATLSFDTNLRTMMGVAPADAMAALVELGVDAIGANCGRGPDEMESIVDQLVVARGDAEVLIVAQSNAGLPQVVGDGFEYTVDPQGLAEHAKRLQMAGVEVIGACCGSSPEHVRAIAQALQES